jgi:hypothetical protein
LLAAGLVPLFGDSPAAVTKAALDEYLLPPRARVADLTLHFGNLEE